MSTIVIPLCNQNGALKWKKK